MLIHLLCKRNNPITLNTPPSASFRGSLSNLISNFHMWFPFPLEGKYMSWFTSYIFISLSSTLYFLLKTKPKKCILGLQWNVMKSESLLRWCRNSYCHPRWASKKTNFCSNELHLWTATYLPCALGAERGHQGTWFSLIRKQT